MSEQGELNISEAAAGIASDLGISAPAQEAVVEDGAKAGASEDGGVQVPAKDPAQEAAEAAAVAVAARPPPKSWAREAHEHWAKIDPKGQEYIETRERQMLEGLEAYKENNALGKSMKEALTPYMAKIAAAGIDAPKAVQALLNAHYRLTEGSPEQRLAAYHELGRNLGLVEAQPATGAAADPVVRQLIERLTGLEGALTQRQQQQLADTRSRVEAEVNDFADAKDEKGNALHPYFDEVWTEMVAFIQAGATMQDAYDRATWANPVTRAKEQERLQALRETEARDRKRAEAAAALKAKEANVRNRDTKRTPTEPLGKMEDTMNRVYDDIKSRATH